MNYADTIRPALQIIGLREDEECGWYVRDFTERAYAFLADTTINIDPSAEQWLRSLWLTAKK